MTIKPFWKSWMIKTFRYDEYLIIIYSYYVLLKRLKHLNFTKVPDLKEIWNDKNYYFTKRIYKLVFKGIGYLRTSRSVALPHIIYHLCHPLWLMCSMKSILRILINYRLYWKSHNNHISAYSPNALLYLFYQVWFKFLVGQNISDLEPDPKVSQKSMRRHKTS